MHGNLPKVLERSSVNCHNEWDPLEEVIVGIVDGACVPPWDPAVKATMPEEHWEFFQREGGKPFSQEAIDAGRRDLDSLVELLEAEGVRVRRPAPVDFSRPYSTPSWQSASGLYAAMPRDILLVAGDELIEAPLSWRSRYHEMDAYRPLLVEYFRSGARWTSAPKPMLRDELFDQEYEEPAGDEPSYVIFEDEPTFDAADFVRCGRDWFAQRSHVTNQLGIEWLRRHLGSAYTIHEVPTRDKHPMHIDATFLPLAPGKLLINPERVERVPAIFADWDVRETPRSQRGDGFVMCSSWIHMNVLMLDEKRVVVEADEPETIEFFRNWGFEPIPCAFRRFNLFGGGFHCATLDVRRTGGLQSYF